MNQQNKTMQRISQSDWDEAIRQLPTDEVGVERPAPATKPAAQKPKSKGGGNTQKKARSNLRRVVSWTYRFGWICPAAADKLVGRVGSGICRSLEKRGILVSRRTEAGGLAGVPSYVYALTPTGVAEAESDALIPFLMPYKPPRNDTMMRHDLAVMRVLLSDLRIEDEEPETWGAWRTDREIKSKAKAGEKCPDLFIQFKDGRKTYYEIELTAKWERDFDQFALGIIQKLTSDQTAKFEILSDANAILRRYEIEFDSVVRNGLPLWKKDTAGKWVQLEKRLPIDQSIRSRINLFNMSQIEDL